MADLLTVSERSSYQEAMQNLHDTFARDIVIYQTASKTLVSTNPKHNFMYGSAGDGSAIEQVVISGTFKARIHYPNEAKLEQFLRAGGSKNDDQIQLKRRGWKVKLIVDESVKSILEKCERIEFDGVTYAVDSSARPHGVVGVQFWDFYLQSNN